MSSESIFQGDEPQYEGQQVGDVGNDSEVVVPPKASAGKLSGQKSQGGEDSSDNENGRQTSNDTAALVGVKVEAGLVER